MIDFQGYLRVLFKLTFRFEILMFSCDTKTAACIMQLSRYLMAGMLEGALFMSLKVVPERAIFDIH